MKYKCDLATPFHKTHQSLYIAFGINSKFLTRWDYKILFHVTCSYLFSYSSCFISGLLNYCPLNFPGFPLGLCTCYFFCLAFFPLPFSSQKLCYLSVNFIIALLSQLLSWFVPQYVTLVCRLPQSRAFNHSVLKGSLDTS